jgi:hypothetical protein
MLFSGTGVQIQQTNLTSKWLLTGVQIQQTNLTSKWLLTGVQIQQITEH